MRLAARLYLLRPIAIMFALLIMLAECDPDIGHRY